MPRSSRHRSHRGHKHSSRDELERSESEEERDLKTDRRKASPAVDVDFAPAEPGKKRKERPSDATEGVDRWNGEGRTGAEVKEPNGEEFEAFEERAGKSKGLGAETRSRSSRRHESERKEEGGGRDELKRRSEKDLYRQDAHYGNGKDNEREHRSSRDDQERAADRESVHGSGRERDRAAEKGKEYVTEREKDNAMERNKEYDRKRDRHSARDRSSDGRREKPSYSSTMGNYEEEYVVKGALETSERSRQDIYDHGAEKDMKKELKRDDLSEKDKWHGDSRKNDDRRVASMDERPKSSGHHDEKYKGSGSRERFHVDFDRDRRSRSDKYRGDRSSRDTNDRSESKYYKDSEKYVDNRNKNRIQGNDSEATPLTKDRGMKHSDNRGTKRSPDDSIEFADLKPRNAKETRSSLDKRVLVNYKPEFNDDRGRPESIHSNRVEFTSSLDNKNSPVSTVHGAQDEYRGSLKQAETVHRSLSKDGHRTSSASSGDPVSASGATGKMLESQSVESDNKLKDFARSVDCVADEAPLQYEKTPRSDGIASAFHSADKSPCSGDRSNSSRKGARRSLDVDETGQWSSYTRDGRDHFIKEEKSRDFSQGQLPNSEAGRVGSLSHCRTDHVVRNSASHLPPPYIRHGMDSPSVLRSGEDDGRGLAGDRKPNNHYKRGGDLNHGRGQGGGWNGVHASWAPPVANGFIPFQHGPSAGFLPVPQQFPPSPMFGVRPFMSFNHAGVPLHMHEPPDRFSGHNQPFGWRNSSDESGPPHIQGWEGNNGMYGNESHMYGRPEWEQNRHLIGDRGWEINGSHWKGQIGNSNMGKETELVSHSSVDEARPEQGISVNEHNLIDNNETKQSIDPARKKSPDFTRKIKSESPELVKTKDNSSDFCITYLSKLDISHELTCPNLFKQCASIVETEENGVSNMDNKHVQDQHANRDVKLITRSLKFSGKPLFSAITDAVFKKAMSLYQKTAGESRIKLNAVERHDACNVPTTPETLEGEPMENALPGEALDSDCPMKMNSEKPAGEDVELVENDDPKTADVDESKALGVIKEDVPLLVPVSSDGDVGMEVDSDKISTAGVESISGGDKRCEELIPECLSRIPYSPKSTH